MKTPVQSLMILCCFTFIAQSLQAQSCNASLTIQTVTPSNPLKGVGCADAIEVVCSYTSDSVFSNWSLLESISQQLGLDQATSAANGASITYHLPAPCDESTVYSFIASDNKGCSATATLTGQTSLGDDIEVTQEILQQESDSGAKDGIMRFELSSSSCIINEWGVHMTNQQTGETFDGQASFDRNAEHNYITIENLPNGEYDIETDYLPSLCLGGSAASGSYSGNITTTFYLDNDGDGYGSKNDSVQAATEPVGYVANNNDCNDFDLLMHIGCDDLVRSDGTWKTIDEQIDGWDQIGFNDNGWDLTTSPSGFDAISNNDCFLDGDSVNSMSNPGCGPNNFTTYYYRKEFQVNFNNVLDSSVVLDFVQDDNSTVYINGSYVWNRVGFYPIPDHIDVTPFINFQGNNIIAIVSQNAYCCGYGLAVRIRHLRSNILYADLDNDGYGNINDTIHATINTMGYVLNNTDCNDNDITVHTPQSYFVDADLDTYGSTTTILVCSSVATSGYSSNDTDCNDQDPNIISTRYWWYPDLDQDGYGINATEYQDASVFSPTFACSPPEIIIINPIVRSLNEDNLYCTDSTDCDDTNGNVHPNATDLCNSIDDDCNNIVDDNAITATISPNSTQTICDGNSVTLSANNGIGILYQWIKGTKNIAGATNQTYNAKKANNYSVYETNSFNCNATSSAVTLIVNPAPLASITSSNLDLCLGTVILTANSGTGYTYQWKKGVNILSGATNQSYTVSMKGTYKVIVTNTLNCSTTSAGSKVVKTCKLEGSEVDLTGVSFNIYPNPSDEKFTISLLLDDETLNSTATLQVVNLLGQVLLEEDETIVNGVLQKELQLNVADGMYIIKLKVNEQQFQSQLFINGH